jgi:16S rRNA processing protein RimM
VVTVLVTVDDRSVFAPGAVLTADDGRRLVVASASPYRDRGALVSFDGIRDRSAAEQLRGLVVTMPAESLPPLAEDEFWPDDLVGLTAVTPSGEELGTVTGVDLGTAQDRIVVTTPSGTEVLVPFVAEFVGDPHGSRIEIRDPGGLF